MGLWNKDEHGEMDSFYANDLVSIIVRIAAADGNISEEEVKYINDNFGFDYTVQELISAYDSCREEIHHSFDENYANGITYMRSINPKLADAYKEMLGLICDIIIESDGVVSDSEAEAINQLKSLL